MNKTGLTAAVAEKTELSKEDAEKIARILTDAVSEKLIKGGKVQLAGFRTFEVSERATRERRDPKIGKTMTIEASKTPKSKAGRALKDEVNK